MTDAARLAKQNAKAGIRPVTKTNTPTKMTYSIRYNHRSSQSATSLAEAKRIVRSQMSTSRMCLVDCADGLYCYESAADRDRDSDGSRAFACISTRDQDQD